MSVLLFIVALGLTAGLTVPPSFGLVAKLRELFATARQSNPELFRAQLAPIDPFDGRFFKHHRITPSLRAELAAFGEDCQRLQREARALDRRAHIGMLPILVYGAGRVLWAVLH